MFVLKIENENKEILDFSREPYLVVTKIDGLAPVKATINANKNIGFDGERFISSYIDARNINIMIKIVGQVEEKRTMLYRYVKTKSPIKLYFKTENRDMWINGYVEDMQIDYFSNLQTVQITVLCPQPYWKDMQEIINESIAIIPQFEFIFSCEDGSSFEFGKYTDTNETLIVNHGDVPTGIEITMRARGVVVNPKIFNKQTAQFFGLEITLQSGDIVEINTNDGLKSVYLIRGAEKKNIFNNIVKGSTWLKLDKTDNIFLYETFAGADLLEISFKHQASYEGV